MKSPSCLTLAYPSAPDNIHRQGLEELQQYAGIEEVVADSKPFILYFVSGGSEAEAVKHLDRDGFQILLGSNRSNAFASAMEVKAYSLFRGYHNVLLNIDDGEDRKRLQQYVMLYSRLSGLAGSRLGLIGEVSEWLVASDIPDNILEKKLGIELVRIPWGEVGNYRDHFPVNDFFEEGRAGSELNIADAGRVSAMLESVVKAYRLDAITVECFSLVRKNQVTACLGLSYLNDHGLPAGCEGDICSVVGIMLVKQLLGEVPWMANVAGIEGNNVLFAHCTAPRSILSKYEIETHYETGMGTAVKGRLEAEEVTLFRVNNTLDRFFVAKGNVVEMPYLEHACRTQLSVELPQEKVNELRTAPLGNHHLVIPGDQAQQLEMLAELLSSPYKSGT